MNRHKTPGPESRTKMMGSRLSLSSDRISGCGLPSERASTRQTRDGVFAHADNLPLRKSHKACDAAVSVLADIVAIDALRRSPSSTLVHVGSVIHKGVRITARILGPTRIDGGVILLTQSTKRSRPSHRVYLLDDLYGVMELNRRRTGCTSDLWELVLKAIARRSRILSTTTNYFCGITGKVIEIL